MQWPSYQPTVHQTVLITAVIIVVQGLANTFTVQLVAVLNRISVWWLLIGLVVIVGALIVIPDHHQSASFVTHFENNTGFTSGLYGGMLGLLVTSWTFTGFDGSFHMSEETVQATVNAPKGITRAIGYSAITGLVLMLALVYSIKDYAKEAATDAPPVQILIDGLGLGTAKAMLLIVIGAMLFCGLANLTSNTRQIFAFSRDGAMPGSRWWHSVSTRTRTPVKAVWLAVGCSLALVVPGWWSHTAFTAIVSVNVVGLFLAYAVPIFLRLRLGDAFQPGPWHLGRWGKPIGWLAVVWIALSSVLFMLPQPRRSPPPPSTTRRSRSRSSCSWPPSGGSRPPAAASRGPSATAAPTRSRPWTSSEPPPRGPGPRTATVPGAGASVLPSPVQTNNHGAASASAGRALRLFHSWRTTCT